MGNMKINIGIKHDFLCINVCWARREALKPEPDVIRAQQMLCIRKACLITIYIALKHFFTRKLWRNGFKKFFFPVSIIVRKSMLPASVLKTLLPGQRLTSSLL